MKTLLVIAPNNALAAAVRAALDPLRYRVIEHTELREDEPAPVGRLDRRLHLRRGPDHGGTDPRRLPVCGGCCPSAR